MSRPPREAATSTVFSYRLRERLPVDLIGLAGFAIVSPFVLVGWDPSSPVVRALFGLPLLVLAPGYAVVAAIYPHGEAPASPYGPAHSVDTLTDVERVALALGMSVLCLPLIGLAVASVDSFAPATVVTMVSGFVVAVTVVATVRRMRLPVERRYRVGFVGRTTAVRRWLVGDGSPLELTVNVALAVAVVLAVSATGFALFAPLDGEQYTTLQLLTEDDSGDLVAADYPDEIEPGEAIDLTVAVDNQEGESVAYLLVIQEEHVEGGEVVDREEHDRLEFDLADDSTGYAEPTIEPTAESGASRIVFLLFEADEVPDEPSSENAYRHTHVWTEIHP